MCWSSPQISNMVILCCPSLNCLVFRYVGVMSRDEATELLANKPHGTYLVRMSVGPRKGDYAMSIKWVLARGSGTGLAIFVFVRCWHLYLKWTTFGKPFYCRHVTDFVISRHGNFVSDVCAHVCVASMLSLAFHILPWAHSLSIEVVIALMNVETSHRDLGLFDLKSHILM